MKPTIAILLSVLLCCCDSTKIKGHSVSYWSERLDDADPHTRMEALFTIESMDRQTVERFRGVLLKKSRNGTDMDFRRSCAGVLFRQLGYLEPSQVGDFPMDDIVKAVNAMPKLDRRDFIAEMKRQSNQGVTKAKLFMQYFENQPGSK